MGMNFLGLGFSFGGKDKGMSTAIENQTKSLGLMGKAVKTLDSILSINRLQTFIDAISLSRLNDIASGLENIATGGRQLTTSFEGQLVAADKAGRATAANLGYSTKAMGKFTQQATNLGIALNIGTEEAGKAVYAWDAGSDVLKAVGIDSAATAAKVEQIFKVDPSQFVYTLKEMQTGLGMNDAAIKRVTDSTLAWGQQSADVAKAMGGMQGQVDHLTKRAHAFGRTMSGDELADWAVSANQAKQLFYGLGFNADKAEKAVESLNEKTLESGKNLGKMFAGTADDLTDFNKAFATTGVDIPKQFDLMKKGPLGFARGMAEMVAKAGPMSDEQLSFVKRQMEASGLGEEATESMFNVFRQGPEATKKMLEGLPKATEDMGKLAKAAFKTGRTLQDTMDLQESQFVARLRTSSTVNQSFVTETGKAYKDWGDKLLKLAKEDGPLGSITKKMIEMHQIGALALIPKTLRPMAGVFGTILKEVGPLIGILGSLGFRLGMLLSPVALVGLALAGLGIWFATLMMEGKSAEEAVASIGVTLMQFFTDLPGKIDTAIQWVSDAFTGAFDESAKPSVWKQTFDMVWASIKIAALHMWSKLGEIAQGFWDGITGNIQAGEKTAGQNIGETLGAAALDGLNYAWGVLKKGAADLFAGKLTGEGFLTGALGLGALITMGPALISILGALGTVLGAVWTGLTVVAPIVFAVVSGLAEFATVAVWVVSALAGVGEGVVLLVAGMVALTAGFMLWPEKTQEAVDWVSNKLKWLSENAFELLTTAIIMAIDWVVDALAGGGDAAGKGFFESIVDWLVKLPSKVFSFFGDVVVGLGKAINGVLSMLEGLVLGALDGIKNALMKRFPASADVISNVFETVKGIVADTFSFIKIGVTVVSQVFSTVFTLIGNVVSSIWNVIAELTGWLFNTVLGPLFNGLWTLVKGVFGAVSWVVTTAVEGWGLIFTGLWENIIKPVWNAVGPYFGALWGGVTSGLKEVQSVATTVFEALRTIFNDVFGALDQWVDDLFGHSISSDIEADLDKAIKFFSDFGGAAGKVLDKVLAPLASVFPSIAVASGDGGKKAVPGTAAPTPALGAGEREAGLVNAVHNPMWYTRYEKVFRADMANLARAIEGIQAGKKPQKRGTSVGPVVGANGGLNKDLLDLTGAAPTGR